MVHEYFYTNSFVIPFWPLEFLRFRLRRPNLYLISQMGGFRLSFRRGSMSLKKDDFSRFRLTHITLFCN